MNNQNDYIEAAQQIIVSLGLPRAQQNERSALCLLALLNLTPGGLVVERLPCGGERGVAHGCKASGKPAADYDSW